MLRETTSHIAWETLKRRVVNHFLHLCAADHATSTDLGISAILVSTRSAKNRPWKECRNELIKEAVSVLESWDVRMVGKLRDLFTHAFPARLRKGHLSAVLDDEGGWIIYCTRTHAEPDPPPTPRLRGGL